MLHNLQESNFYFLSYLTSTAQNMLTLRTADRVCISSSPARHRLWCLGTLHLDKGTIGEQAPTQQHREQPIFSLNKTTRTDTPKQSYPRHPSTQVTEADRSELAWSTQREFPASQSYSAKPCHKQTNKQTSSSGPCRHQALTCCTDTHAGQHLHINTLTETYK